MVMCTNFWRRAKMNMGTKDEAKEGQIDGRKRNEVSAGERTYVYRNLMESDLL